MISELKDLNFILRNNIHQKRTFGELQKGKNFRIYGILHLT